MAYSFFLILFFLGACLLQISLEAAVPKKNKTRHRRVYTLTTVRYPQGPERRFGPYNTPGYNTHHYGPHPRPGYNGPPYYGPNHRPGYNGPHHYGPPYYGPNHRPGYNGPHHYGPHPRPGYHGPYHKGPHHYGSNSRDPENYYKWYDSYFYYDYRVPLHKPKDQLRKDFGMGAQIFLSQIIPIVKNMVFGLQDESKNQFKIRARP
ncbi:hypothetical protein B5X24_HaOG208449 [Helicoverpa armigera]|uniref:Uncharacterized protein n=1 Tax=Helicoverpa armigera TaxID=29058 RepID=A0A2W1BI83_HELAM|nr:hypothetical protein B5X24_HaOG208449 [Helicoverpa armigera]